MTAVSSPAPQVPIEPDERHAAVLNERHAAVLNERHAAVLNERHAAVVRATLPAIAAHIDEITARFYRSLFAAHPELLRDRFNRGNQADGAQQRALAAAIATYATHLVDPRLPDPRELLTRIGHKHASLGVTAAEYPIVHEHLFGAIVSVLGTEVVTAEVAAAWDQVYWLLADTLIGLEDELYAEAGVRAGDVFREVVVLDRRAVGEEVIAFTVESADPARPLPDFVPGQYISVGVTLSDGARQLRQYSLIDAPRAGRLSFAVRRARGTAGRPDGAVSAQLHTGVAVGDRLTVTLPFGDLTIDAAVTTPLVLISAGIGITPMLGILDQLAVGRSERRVLVMHADRSAQAHPLAREQRDRVAALPAAELHVWYEQPSAGARSGTLSLDDLTLPADADYYLCGPTGFLQAVRAQLHAAAVPSGRVHVELFAPDDWLLTP